MNLDTARQLNHLNKAFYETNHASFSATRFTHWPGWARVLQSAGRPERILDVACGNMRFRRYLENALGAHAFAYCGIDCCPQLVPEEYASDFRELDIVDLLLASGGVDLSADEGGYDLVVAFGLMHHVPTNEARIDLLNSLLDAARPKGIAAVSFWDFLSDAKLAAKAACVTEREALGRDLSLDRNDYLLDWQESGAALRYCHSFDEAEVDALANACATRATIIDRFASDGRTSSLNKYLVMSKR